MTRYTVRSLGICTPLRLFQQQCLIHTDSPISIVTFILTDHFFHGIRQFLILLWAVFVIQIFIEALPADSKHPAIKCDFPCDPYLAP